LDVDSLSESNDSIGVVGTDGNIVTQLHRLVLYGDHLQSVKHMSVLVWLHVVEEL